jgi:hypothetical protein
MGLSPLRILPARGQDQDDAALLTMRDIARMRRQGLSHEEIAEKAARQGVGFEVTPAVQNQLRRLGFKPDQIQSIKDSSKDVAKDSSGAGKKAAGGDKPAALVPGQELRTTDAQRDTTLEQITQVTKASGAEVQPVPSQHITLWAAKDAQAVFLPDVKKVEKFFQSKCKEPIRSGLDKRSAHVLLIARRYEYERWINGLIAQQPERFQWKDQPPQFFAEWKARILKGPGLFCSDVCVFCMEGLQPDYVHRLTAAAIGYMYFTQLAEYQKTDPLVTGFANGAESIVAGSPTVLIFGHVYAENRDLGVDPRAWLHLVQRRMITREVSAPGRLLAMDANSNMLLPHYAEAWTLVALLAKQPDKFGELVTSLRAEKAPMKMIEQVYGWDEKQLAEQWRKYVLGQK